MNPAIADLLAPASFRLSKAEAVLPPFVESAAGPLAGELQALLRVRNGFYAFSNALHVFPSVSSDLSWGLRGDWNMPGRGSGSMSMSPSRWIPGLCFAQDTFGNLFSIKEGTICRFEADDGRACPRGRDPVAKWAELIQSQRLRLWTSWPRRLSLEGEAWAHPRSHQRSAARERPSACGGSDASRGAGHAIDAALLLGFWGKFATQIHDLPDGATINSAILRRGSRQAEPRASRTLFSVMVGEGRPSTSFPTLASVLDRHKCK